MGVFHQRGFARTAFHVCRDSKLLLFMMFPAFSLLLFPLLHPGSTLVLRLFASFSRLFEGSASVFLLLNGVVVTIIASSKVEQSITARGAYASCGIRDVEMKGRMNVLSSHGQDCNFESRAENHPGLGAVHPEGSTKVGEENQDNKAFIEEICDDSSEEGQQGQILILDCSADNDEEDEVSGNDENGHEGAARSGIVLTTSGGDGVCNPTPAEEEAPSAEDVWAAIVAAKAGGDLTKASSKCFLDDNGRGGAANIQPADAKASDGDGPAASTEEAPSAEEVWAAIMLEKNGMKVSTDKRSEVGNAVPNAASAGGAATVKAERPPWKSSPAVMGANRHGHGHGHGGGESEEDLDRRAEEFIARFNERMRLQRLESLRRRRAQRRAHQRRGGHRLQRHHSRGSNCLRAEVHRPLAARVVL